MEGDALCGGWIMFGNVGGGRQSIAKFRSTDMFPCFFPETGRFLRKTGRRLSTNGQSLRGIRDLDDFSKSK
jgi:hypothetical protein